MSYTERVDPVWMEKGAGPPSDFDVDTIGNPALQNWLPSLEQNLW